MTTAALEDPDVFAKGYASLSRTRREKIDRIAQAQEKRLSLAAGLLLDRGLQERGLRERQMVTAQGRYGKPYFPERPDIRFSLSHSGQMAMAVFSDTETGCDIQQMKEPNEKLARRFFCREETDWLLAAESETERKIRFYRLWTLKESYLKATGEGLHLAMDSFCFSMDPVTRIRRPSDGAEDLFEEYAFGGYRAAVCQRCKV